MQQTFSNRREADRFRALKGAKIRFDDLRTIIDCTIRNISDTGAKLVTSSPLSIPDHFRLRLDDGREHRCTVRWRKLTEFGVEFVG